SADYPKMVIDRQGLPRVFYKGSSNVLGFARCTQTPCTTAANWSSTNLLSTGGVPRAGVDPLGRTYFTHGLGGATWVAGQNPDGGYTPRHVSNCNFDVTSFDDPGGYPSTLDRFRIAHARTVGGNDRLYFTWETP